MHEIFKDKKNKQNIEPNYSKNIEEAKKYIENFTNELINNINKIIKS